MMPRILSCLTALLLAACTPPPVRAPLPLPPPPMLMVCPPVPVAVPAVDTGAVVNELLLYQAGLRGLGPVELVKVLTDLNTKPGSGSASVRRAMLLTALRGNGDLGRAQGMLEAVAQSTAADDAQLRPLARALLQNLVDLRHQDDNVDRLNNQVREAQRRNDQLNEKLEALKNIERTLSVRPPAANPSPPAK